MEQQLDLFEENNDYIVRKNKKILYLCTILMIKTR